MKRITGPRWHICIGPPGTGKTRTLAKTYVKELAGGARADRLFFVTFSRRARAEALDRFQNPKHGYNLPDCDVIGVRTMHSLSYGLLQGRHGKMMRAAEWREFRALTGWKTEKGAKDRSLLDALNWGRARGLSDAETERRAPQGPDRLLFRRFLTELKNFKRGRSLLDYHDTLDLVLTHELRPDAAVLIFDEAQDFSPVQAQVADLWAGSARRAFVGADDDQAIFVFQGASPVWVAEKFRAHRGTVLAQSYRVPRLVHALAEKIIGGVQGRVPKRYAPRDAEGEIVRVRHLDDLIDQLDGTKNLVLARNKYVLDPLASRLRARKILFAETERDLVDSDTEIAIVAADAAVALANGACAPACDIVELLGLVDHRRRALLPARGAVISTLDAMGDAPVPANYVQQLIGGGTLLHELRAHGPLAVMTRIEEPVRKVVAARLAGGGPLNPKVTLSTIHAAKGAEADVVAIIPDMAPQSYAEFQRDPDAERRVAYVAVTRSSRRLVLMAPQTTRFFKY